MKRIQNLKKTVCMGILLIAVHGMQAQQTENGHTHSGQSTGQAPFPLNEYAELKNPVAADMELWKKVKGVKVGWGNIDTRYKKEEPVTENLNRQIRLQAWRGERVSAQFVVFGNRDIDALQFEVSDLKKGADRIGREGILKGFVRYVMTDELNRDGRGGCGQRPDAAFFDSTLVADPIDHITPVLKMKANSTQGCWVRVYVPREAKAGKYSGKVTVKDGEKVLATLKLDVEVSRRVLPKVKDWTFHLDLWQNPYAVARYHQVKPWSEEHMAALKPYMEMYRNAGGKSITASIMHKPWNGQTYDYFESMVTWVKRLDGTWYFDYAVFDKWVQFMMDLGIDKQINCYSMVPWRLSFQYFDQATNSLQSVAMQPGDKEYEEIWTAMLTSFAQHLKEKGWFGKTMISMDERPMPVMLKTLAVIRKADPDFKISLAGALHKELEDELDDYCVALRMKYSDEVLAKRRKEGKVTTYYTSCEEPYPNTFTFADPADCEWLGWYAAKANLDGYLRWAFNSWVVEPLMDSRFYTWAAGDTYLVYPGARTSIRFERMIDGIQMYEKIRILKEEYAANGDENALKTIDKALQLFDEAKLPDVPSAVTIAKAREALRVCLD